MTANVMVVVERQYDSVMRFVRFLEAAFPGVPDLESVDVRAYVSEPQLAQLRLGQQVQVSVDAGGAKGSSQTTQRQGVTGTVTWISSLITIWSPTRRVSTNMVGLQSSKRRRPSAR